MADKTDRKPVSAFDLFGKSYEIVMNNLKNFAILLALPAIASLVATSKYKLHGDTSKFSHINFFSSTEPAYAIVGLVSAGVILFVVLAVAALIIQAMLTSLEVESSTGKKPLLSHLWAQGKKYWLRLFGLSLAIGMYIVMASLIGGLILFIAGNGLGAFVGIMLIAVAILFVLTHYYLAPYAMIDEDLKVFAAMERSADISKPYAGAVLSVIGVSILLGFAGIVPIIGPIASFILASLYTVAPALRYQELKKLSK
ncbi:MAG: hypothetical protein ACXWLH_02415 [Candidatus Saccharimonadales bacterium]